MSSIFCLTLGPLVLGWAPNNFILGAQLAPGEKRVVCIPAALCIYSIWWQSLTHPDGSFSIIFKLSKDCNIFLWILLLALHQWLGAVPRLWRPVIILTRFLLLICGLISLSTLFQSYQNC